MTFAPLNSRTIFCGMALSFGLIFGSVNAVNGMATARFPIFPQDKAGEIGEKRQKEKNVADARLRKRQARQPQNAQIRQQVNRAINRRVTNLQLRLGSVQGDLEIWRVQLISPAPGNPTTYLAVVATNSQFAAQKALQKFPGCRVGSISRIR